MSQPGFWTDENGFSGGPKWKPFPTLSHRDVVAQCSGVGMPQFKPWQNDLFITRPQRVYPNLEECPLCFDGPLLI